MNHGLLIKPRESDWKQEDGKITFQAVTSGDWTKYQWFNENQRNPNFDNDGCACYAAQKVIDAQMDCLWPTLPSSLQDWLIKNNYLDTGKDGNMHFHSSPRWIENLTGNRLNGNSLPECLDAVRKYGLIPYTSLPFTPAMTVDEYFSPIPQALMALGQQFLAQMGGKNFLQYHWLNDGSPKNTSLMQSAMLQAPLEIGVAVADDWNTTNPNPDPPASAPPGHALMVDKMESPATEVCDNYIPYEKILDEGYPINYCLQAVVRYLVAPTPPPVPIQGNLSIWSRWLSAVAAWLRQFTDPGSLGAARSPKWEDFKKQFALTHLPVCAVCGKSGRKAKLAYHHLRPFHAFPELELVEDNIRILCAEHHLYLAHLGNFSSIDPQGADDIIKERDKYRNRPMTVAEIKDAFSKVA
ncbi:MAG: HNH endonuclease [Patescibacteria group bacterium]|nr:HNH endonuclease [Patescibacteria group bacterium]